MKWNKRKGNVDLYREHKGSVRQLCLTGKLPTSAGNLSLQHRWNSYLLLFVFCFSGRNVERHNISFCVQYISQQATCNKWSDRNVSSKVFLNLNKILRNIQVVTLRASVQAFLPSFISVSKGNLMQNVYGLWHKRWWCGSVHADLCAKSLKHLCKHMAFFQPYRQCSHSLKIDVQGSIPCPGAILEWLWTSEKPWASSNVHFQYPSFIAKHRRIQPMAFIWLFVVLRIGSIIPVQSGNVLEMIKIQKF